MRGAFAAMVFLAACGGSGVDLEVGYDGHFDHVEVFVGNAECYYTNPATQQSEPCPGVAWMGGQIRPPGDVYVMRGDEKIISIDEVKNGTATIHLEATDGYRQPPVIAAVAFDGDTAVAFGTIWGAKIPANAAEHWNLELDKAGSASDEVKVPPGDSQPDKRVHAWARERVNNPAELSRCLAMQFWNDDEHVWKSKFIVPETDTDCDGQEIECDPLYADFNTTGSPSACLTRSSSFVMHPCAIGNSQCADGIRPTDACTLPPDGLTCIPDAACTACEGAPDTVSCLVDAFSVLPPDPTLSAFRCSFNYTDGGSPCSVDQASNTAAFYLPIACKSVLVRDLTTPLVNGSSPSTADIGNPGMARVDATVSTNASSCVVKLRWTDGTVDTSGPTGKTFIFALTSSTTNNVIAFPVRIEFGGPATTCSTNVGVATTCMSTQSTMTDSMLECLR